MLTTSEKETLKSSLEEYRQELKKSFDSKEANLPNIIRDIDMLIQAQANDVQKELLEALPTPSE